MTTPFTRTEWSDAAFPAPPLYPLDATRRARAIELLHTYLPGTRQMVRQALAANLLNIERGHPAEPVFASYPDVTGPITADYLADGGLIPTPAPDRENTEALEEMACLVRHTIILFLEKPRSEYTATPTPEPAKPTADPDCLHETRTQRAYWILDNMTVPLPGYEHLRARRTVRRALASNLLGAELGDCERPVFSTPTQTGDITDIDLVRAGMLPGYNGELTEDEVRTEMRLLVREVVIALASPAPEPPRVLTPEAQALDPIRAHAATAAAHACAPMYAALPDVDAADHPAILKLTAQALTHTAKVLEGYLRGETL